MKLDMGQIEREMENAIAQRQFMIYVQPKYDVDTGRVAGGEALVRWKHPEWGIVSPGEFIPVFERNGFIRKLDYYVWEETCAFIQDARKRGRKVPPISVNVSRIHFYGSELQNKLEELMARYGLSHDDIELEITETMVRSGAVDIVIVDSVAALVPKAEIDGEMGDSHVGLQARLMSQALRKLTAVISKSNCIVIFINQLREKVGVMFGNPETTTGGRALKFYSSVRMDVRRIESLKMNGEVIGNRTRIKVVKNKIAPPFREAEFDIMFGQGISKEGDILDIAANEGIVQKTGAWFAYNENKIGQGRENAKAFLKNNPEVLAEIENKVRAKFDMPELTEAE